MPKTDPATVPLDQRFWMRTGYCDPRSNACMEWLGSTLSTGYGQLHEPPGPNGEPGRLRYAHQVSYELNRGPIPPGHVVRHVVCNNPSCVRPSHLEVGTQADNMADRRKAGRTRIHEPLDESIVAACRYLYESGKYSQAQIARLLLDDGAQQPQVNKLLQGLTYKNAPGPITSRGRGRRPPKRTKK